MSFQVSPGVIEREYKKLQAEFHPDRFVDADDSQRLKALQQASMINDAYETLNSPLKRAAYLLQLNNIDPEEHNQNHLQEGFLLKQLELREELESLIEKEDMNGLDGLKSSVETEKADTLQLFESHYGQEAFPEAKAVYNKLQFLFKLLDEIDKAEERLLDY